MKSTLSSESSWQLQLVQFRSRVTCSPLALCRMETKSLKLPSKSSQESLTSASFSHCDFQGLKASGCFHIGFPEHSSLPGVVPHFHLWSSHALLTYPAKPFHTLFSCWLVWKALSSQDQVMTMPVSTASHTSSVPNGSLALLGVNIASLLFYHSIHNPLPQWQVHKKHYLSLCQDVPGYHQKDKQMARSVRPCGFIRNGSWC